MAIDGSVPAGARELTTGQANRVWYVDGPVPYVLKHYGDPARAANEAAALTILAQHDAPAPRLLDADSGAGPAWTAQAVVHAETVPAGRLLNELAKPLAAVHRIPGPHAGRLAGAQHHSTWRDYLHNRLDTYAAAAPDLATAVAAIRHDLDDLDIDIEPRLLHHDLQPGHLVRLPNGRLLLLDWELAVFGDPLSDLARLAVRLQLIEPTPVLELAHRPEPIVGRRLRLYWRIHHLANTALSSDPKDRIRAPRPHLQKEFGLCHESGVRFPEGVT